MLKRLFEKNKNCDRMEIFTAIVIIALLLVVFIYMIISNLVLHFGVNTTNNNVNVNYEKLYPFGNKRIQHKKNLVEKYQQFANSIKDKSEEATTKRLFGYEKLVEYSYVYNDIILYDMVPNFDMNSRIDLKEGYLSRIVPNKKDVTKSANNLLKFKEFLDNKKIKMLYVQTPHKISYSQENSRIYKDYSSENTDSFLELINEKIEYIDLREEIKKDNLNYLSLFYKTDSHWLPETGLWATNEISNYLNKEFDLDTDKINYKNFHYKVYKDIFLGYEGRYVTLRNSKPEDFSVILPKFDTSMSIKILDKKINTTSTYKNTLIDWSRIGKGNYYKENQYTAYLYGNMPLIEIHNNLINNNKKILVIKDSFANVMTPFLACENEYLSIIDLRKFNGSLKTYINYYSPDAVLVIYNSFMLAELDGVDANNDEFQNIWNFD